MEKRMLSAKKNLISIIFLSLITACSVKPTIIETQGADRTTEPLVTFSPTPTQISLPSVSPSSITPEPTKLPSNTYSMETSRWPEFGDLLQPIDGDFSFETLIQDLSPGRYLVFLNGVENTINYASLDNDLTGVLITLGESLGLPNKLFRRDGELILAERSSTWRFYNLSDMSTWRIGPLCDSIYMAVSPSGEWLMGACSQTEWDEQGNKLLILQIVSTKDGLGHKISLPFSGSIYDLRFEWFDADRLIVSSARDSGKRANCAISFIDQLAYCPPIIPASSNISYSVRDLGKYVAFTNLDVSPKTAKLIPSECLILGEDCSGVIDLGGIEGFITPSPNFDIVGWITGIGLEAKTRIGIFDPITWESHQIVELEGNYTIDTWCPDSSCLIIYLEETFKRYRLDLDGTLTVLPFEKVIGSFSIP
jgi:hypothetical protein